MGEISTPFIPAWLDDYGLKTSDFRVLCRVCRRGDCFESVPNIAEGCRLHEDTVRASLNRLVALGLITKQKRPGEPSIYRLNPSARTRPTTPKSRGGLSDSDTDSDADMPPRSEWGTPPETSGGLPPETRGDEGSPIQGSPLKGCAPSAPSIESVIAFGALHGVSGDFCRWLHRDYELWSLWEHDDGGGPRDWRKHLLFLWGEHSERLRSGAPTFAHC